MAPLSCPSIHKLLRINVWIYHQLMMSYYTQRSAVAHPCLWEKHGFAVPLLSSKTSYFEFPNTLHFPLRIAFPQNLYYLIAKSFKVSNYSLSVGRFSRWRAISGGSKRYCYIVLFLENHLKSTYLPSRQTLERGVIECVRNMFQTCVSKSSSHVLQVLC